VFNNFGGKIMAILLQEFLSHQANTAIERLIVKNLIDIRPRQTEVCRTSSAH
jgi:hypothetical protein